MKIPYINLAAQYASLREEILPAIDNVLVSGHYVLGNTVVQFEDAFRKFCQTAYAVGVGNGTEALVLALKSQGIGPGDEVITVPNSFLATAGAIANTGARPVFVDVGADFNMDPDLLEQAITPLTRAILPVHLTGRPADMRPILNIAEKYGLAVIEDAAQAAGAKYQGQPVGGIGIAGCFSFHPLKTLNAFGDGGIITTNDKKTYDYLIKARNHGLINRNESTFFGINSRLDAIQAEILRIKLDHIDHWNKRRRQIARFYRDHLSDVLECPQEKPHEFSVYHTFMVQSKKRNELKAFLFSKGIETKIHYPVPIHLQPASKPLGYGEGDFPIAEKQSNHLLSLPIYQDLTSQQVTTIVETINQFPWK